MAEYLLDDEEEERSVIKLKHHARSESAHASYLEPFNYHGVILSEQGNQGRGDCPFCDKSNHFYVNKTSGLWDCKSCGESGNLYDFLGRFHDLLRKDSDESELVQASKLRKGIPPKAFERYELVKYGNKLVLPIRNANGTVLNLRTYDTKSPHPQWFNTPAPCQAQLFGLSNLKLKGTSPSTPIYLCEGEWDAIALQHLFDKTKTKAIVLAVPGANVFKKHWRKHFTGHPVYLAFDNDSPGSEGMDRVVRLLLSGDTGLPARIYKIRWPVDRPKGYDISDLVTSALNKPKRVLHALGEMFHPVDQPGQSSPTRIHRKVSFPELLRAYKKRMHMTQDTEDALKIVLAVAFSAKIPGDPLWMFLVGPPGSGKSLLLRSLEGSESCVFKSKLLPKTLASGYKTEDGSDPSLLPNLKQKTLIVKDYTAIKSMPLGVQEELYGVLRDAYDGRVDVQFGNGVLHTYEDCYFAMVAGVTDVIHGDSRATLGERFLKFELVRGHYDPRKHVRAAIDNMAMLASSETALREITGDFLAKPVNPAKLPKVPNWVKDRILALSQVVAYLRAGVDRHGYRSRPEVSTRLAKTIIKLGQCICIVLAKPSIDTEVYRIMEQVAFDTSIGWAADIVRTMIRYYPKPVDQKTISNESNISESTTRRKLDELIELGAVVFGKRDSSGRGRRAEGYVLATDLAGLWKEAQIKTKAHSYKALNGRAVKKKKK